MYERKNPHYLKRFVETFVGDEIHSVGGYLLNDILVPGIKKIFFDSVSGGLEMSLWGESSRRDSRRRDGGSRISYESFSKPEFRRTERVDRDDRRTVAKKGLFDDILFNNKWEADEVFGSMFDIVTEYEFVSVSDLRGMVGLDSTFTDDNYGWDEDTITRGDVKRTRDGWIIDLPSPRARE